MREICLSGSEGGAVYARPYPYLSRPFGPLLLTGSLPVSESQVEPQRGRRPQPNRAI